MERGFDVEVYGEHLLSLLAAELSSAVDTASSTTTTTDLEHFLTDCSIPEDEIVHLAQTWREIARRGRLTDEEEQRIIRSRYEDLDGSIPQPSSEPTPMPYVVEEGVEWWEEEPEATDDLDIYCSEVDWLAVIESVEEILKTKYQISTDFSPEALFYALSMSGQHVEYAAQLLQNGALVLEACKPCRHMMHSKCLRRDCTFDHDLGSYPCRYWLFHQCANASASDDPSMIQGRMICPFMHALPYVEWQQPEPATEEYLHTTESSTSDLTNAFPALSTEFTSKKNNHTKGYLAAVKTSSSSSNSVFSFADQVKQHNSSNLTHYFPSSSSSMGFAEILKSHNFLLAATSANLNSTRNQRGISVGEWVESGKQFPSYTTMLLILT